MTNPIQLLEQKLSEINDIKDACHKTENYTDLPEVKRQAQMYIASIHILNQSLNK